MVQDLPPSFTSWLIQKLCCHTFFPLQYYCKTLNLLYILLESYYYIAVHRNFGKESTKPLGFGA